MEIIIFIGYVMNLSKSMSNIKSVGWQNNTFLLDQIIKYIKQLFYNNIHFYMDECCKLDIIS